MRVCESVRPILALFWLDVFALSLVSLASFLFIGEHHANILFLGWALSLRTFSSAISSYLMAALIETVGAKRLLIYSQIFSVFIIAILALGFSDKNNTLILLGVVALGIPYVSKNILMTIYFKSSSLQDEIFRQKSGHRELLFGLARFCACICAPLFLFYFGIYTLMLLALCISMIGFFFALFIRFFNTAEKNCKKSSENSAKIFFLPETWEYICKCTSVLLLVSFIALLASSNQLSFSTHIPTIWRQLLWSIEALMMMLAGAIYVKFKALFKNQFLCSMIILNSVLLLPLLYSKNIGILILISGVLSLSVMLGFYVFRDDYVLKAGNHDKLIKRFSSFSSTQQYLIYTISPLLLTYLFKNYTLRFVVVIILIIQLMLLFLSTCIANFSKKCTNRF